MAFHLAEAIESDVPRLMEIQFAAFAQEPMDQVLNGTDTPENHEKAGARLLNQMRTDPSLHTVKCVSTDRALEMETIVGFCMWHIYDKPRPRDEWMKEHEMLSCSWIRPDEVRDKVRMSIAPLLTGRQRLEGRPHALLMFLTVDPMWQRRGAGRMLLKWGADRCDEIGIPSYLEATPFGYPLYRSCGFEDYEPLTISVDGEDVTYPTMLRQPKRKGS